MRTSLERLAIDTNVWVRLITADDPAQFERARRLFEQHHIPVPVTVWRETEWVLRYSDKLRPAEIAKVLRGVPGLPAVDTEVPSELSSALDSLAEGTDFANALHLFLVDPETPVATFDRGLGSAAMARGHATVAP